MDFEKRFNEAGRSTTPVPPAPADQRMGPGGGFALAILDALSAGVILTDTEGLIIYANTTAAHVLGAEPAACLYRDAQLLLGRSIKDICGREDEPEQRYESSFNNLAGEPQRVGISAKSFRPFGDHCGFVLHFRPLLRDGLPDESTMRHMERLASIGQMVAGFAHEVRNPLAALRTLTDDLALEIPPEDHRAEHVTRIVRNVRRLEDLIRTSLQFGRPATPSVRPHAPRGIVDAALELVAPRVRQLGAPTSQISVEDSGGHSDVRVDLGQLVQVLVILLNNALDAAGDPALVSIRLRSVAASGGRPSVVMIEVEDKGSGMPESSRAQIFNAFFTTKDTGTGLGLSIAQKLVHENGGQIGVRSEEGLGSTFSVELEGIIE